MKNIIQELEDRLSEINEERRKLQNRLKLLAEMEGAIQLLLREERARFQSEQLALLPIRSINGRKVIGRTPISRFLVQALGNGKPRSLKELVELAKAENMNFGLNKSGKPKSPARVFHFALVGLMKTGYANMAGKGIWQLTDKALSLQDKQPDKSKG